MAMFPRHIMLTDCCLPPITKEEAYTLVRLFELEKTKSKSLKHYLGLVAGVSALVILLLGACTFGAVFVAVKATKDTQVSTSGVLMNRKVLGCCLLLPKAHASSSLIPLRILLFV